MTEVLGAEHPHTLFAEANYANVLFDEGQYEEVRGREERALAALRVALGEHHPEALAVAANLSLTLRALGREAEGLALRDEVLTELRRLLGEDNGITRVATREQRIYRDLEPLGV